MLRCSHAAPCRYCILFRDKLAVYDATSGEVRGCDGSGDGDSAE